MTCTWSFALVSLIVSVGCRGESPREKLIYNGTFASINDYPHTVYIILMVAPDAHEGTDRERITWCTGFIIDRRWVLTAAHCPVKEEIVDAKIRMGIDSLMQDGYIVNVDLVQCHPNYTKSECASDICLLRTDESILYSSSIRPIALATVEDEASISKGNISGWGVTGWPWLQRLYIFRLQETTVPIVDNFMCANLPHRVYGDRDMYICTSDPYTGACSGDSGSSLVWTNSAGVKVALGVASGGAHCLQYAPPPFNRTTIAYTRISSHRSWIESIKSRYG